MVKLLAAFFRILFNPWGSTTYTGNYCEKCGAKCWEYRLCYSCYRTTRTTP